MNYISIRGLEISACHGVLEFEKTAAQPFIFDADLFYDFYEGAKRDDLSGTVNYDEACGAIAEIARGKRYNLIESLAYDCAFALAEKYGLEGVKLTVWKPQAPVKQKFEKVGVTVELKRERAYLSLGSSMGDKKRYLDRAIEMLGSVRGIKVEKASAYIGTQPYGGVAQNTFLNCAVEIITYLTPRQLLGEIHVIENALGRVREKRWGDRTLDIDIIFFGDKTVCEPDLVIPHPDWKNREFVKVPLAEIGCKRV